MLFSLQILSVRNIMHEIKDIAITMLNAIFPSRS